MLKPSLMHMFSNIFKLCVNKQQSITVSKLRYEAVLAHLNYAINSSAQFLYSCFIDCSSISLIPHETNFRSDLVGQVFIISLFHVSLSW